jgi:hypothetical protein
MAIPGVGGEYASRVASVIGAGSCFAVKASTAILPRLITPNGTESAGTAKPASVAGVTPTGPNGVFTCGVPAIGLNAVSKTPD